MRLVLTILAFVAVFPVGSALADDECFVPMADWEPREAVAALAAQKGWTVRRIKIDDGCYEIRATDAEGRAFKAKLDPETLKVLKIKQDDHQRDRARDRDHDGAARQTRPPTSDGASAPSPPSPASPASTPDMAPRRQIQ